LLFTRVQRKPLSENFLLSRYSWWGESNLNLAITPSASTMVVAIAATNAMSRTPEE
jgi:hypothetical protein